MHKWVSATIASHGCRDAYARNSSDGDRHQAWLQRGRSVLGTTIIRAWLLSLKREYWDDDPQLPHHHTNPPILISEKSSNPPDPPRTPIHLPSIRTFALPEPHHIPSFPPPQPPRIPQRRRTPPQFPNQRHTFLTRSLYSTYPLYRKPVSPQRMQNPPFHTNPQNPHPQPQNLGRGHQHRSRHFQGNTGTTPQVPTYFVNACARLDGSAGARDAGAAGGGRTHGRKGVQQLTLGWRIGIRRCLWRLDDE